MHPLVAENLQSIVKLCRDHGVSRLEAFGSILRDDFNVSTSDVDLLVEFESSHSADFANFLDLKDSLETVLQRPVDLVELKAVQNQRLRRHIEMNKFPIYDAA